MLLMEKSNSESFQAPYAEVLQCRSTQQQNISLPTLYFRLDFACHTQVVEQEMFEINNGLLFVYTMLLCWDLA